MEPLFVHVHLPKAGGTSINSALQWWFKDRHHNWYHPDPYHEWTIAEMEDLIQQNPRLISLASHYIRQFPPALAGRRIYYFSFIREPLSWFISRFTFVKKHYRTFSEELKSYYPANAEEMPLSDLVEAVLKRESADPLQGNWLNRFFSEGLYRNKLRNWNLSDYPKVCLELSKLQMRSMSLIGLTENFEQSFQALRTFICGFGHDLPTLNAPVENVSADMRDDLKWLTPNTDLGKKVYDLLDQDFRLYQFARELSEVQVKNLSEPKKAHPEPQVKEPLLV